MKKIVPLLMSLSILLVGCEFRNSNNISPIGNIQIGEEAIPRTSKPINVNTPESLIDVSLNLLKSIDTTSQNTLISPTSISIALAMVANGANNESAQHFNNFFGVENIEEINSKMESMIDDMQSEEEDQILKIANAIWYNNNSDLKVKDDFLNKSRNIYNAEVSSLNFSQNSKSVEQINNWVKEKTNNMIKEIVKPTNFTNETEMVLTNSTLFDFKWIDQYTESQVEKNKFKGQDKTSEVEFLTSTERSYMETKDMVGIQKYYQGGRYSFVGIMPKKNIKISNFINELTSEDIKNFMDSEKKEKTDVKIPKFTYDYDTSLKDSLSRLGLENEFDRDLADFSKMYNLDKTSKNIFMNDVIHKTHIEVSESGTKAAAVTSVIMFTTDSIELEKPKTITFDKPFLYMIYDHENELPLFIGTILNLE